MQNNNNNNIATINDTRSSSSSIDGHYQKPHVPHCARCRESFGSYENMAQTKPDEFWHSECFVCSHCFRPFGDKLEYYEKFGRKYCTKDFITLFAPCCAKCKHQITRGRCIWALNKSWHPNCFLCDQCNFPLTDCGFVKSHQPDNSRQQRREPVGALCYPCSDANSAAIKTQRHFCFKCETFIEENDGPPLRYQDETYHAYHFNCHSCGIELRAASATRQVNRDLYCLRCHDTKLDRVPICGGCRRPIEDERYVTALGKQWHVDHFVCVECERPFNGKRHFEINALAYCEQDGQRLFGHRCCADGKLIEDDVIIALDKYYCRDHFCCHFCKRKLVPNKPKFFDVKSELCCKKCYKLFPPKYRKQLAKEKELERHNQNSSPA